MVIIRSSKLSNEYIIMDVLKVSLESFHEGLECSEFTNPAKLLEENSHEVESGSEVYRPWSFAIEKAQCSKYITRIRLQSLSKL